MAKKSTEVSIEEKLRALYDLQYIDSRLNEIRNIRGELPIEVEDLEIEIERLEKRIEKSKSEIVELNNEISAKKEVINHSQNLIDRYKTQQDNARNNKEFETLGKEIEYQELEIQLAEKRIKEFSEKILHKEEYLTEIKSNVSNLKSHLEYKKSELETLIAETQKEEEFLIKKSQEFSEKIDKRLLASYQKIRQNSNNDLAVVGIERGAPKGSFFTIPIQKQVEIAQRKKIIIDEHSGKILVDEDLVNEENAKMEKILKL